MADGNQLPAPKTFAPSREDVLSTLAFFFGDPATPEKLKDYSEHHAMYAPHCPTTPHLNPTSTHLCVTRAQDLPFSRFDVARHPIPAHCHTPVLTCVMCALPRRCFNATDAFYGQNKCAPLARKVYQLFSRACVLFRSKIRETLNSLILHSPQEWQTGVALPFVRIEGTVSRPRHTAL